MGLLNLFRTRFQYEPIDFSREERRETLKAEFYRLRRLLEGAQRSGAPLMVRVPAVPADRLLLQRQLKSYLLLVEKEQGETQQYYRQTEDPKYLETLVELGDLGEWLKHAIQYASSSDPTNEQRDESRHVVVELPAFEGTCRVAFKDNAAISILFAVRPGHYTATMEDDQRGITHTVAFTTRGENELYALVFPEEGVAPIERGRVVISDGRKEEAIPLD